MMDLLRATTARIEELRPQVEEYARLQEVEAYLRAQLEAPPALPSGTAKPKAARDGRPLHIGGQRAKDIVECVRKKPNITVPEIAGELGIGDTGVYRIARALAEDGQIVRDGRGYVLPAAAPD